MLFAARFRECAARSLFLPRTDPGRRVPLWQQRLRAAQLLNAARLKRNFPLLLETARECLQDDYDMPALRRIMTDIQSGNIGLVDVTTDIASPFAENLLFGYVGTVMYQYDVLSGGTIGATAVDRSRCAGTAAGAGRFLGDHGSSSRA